MEETVSQLDLVVLDDEGNKTVLPGEPIVLLPCLAAGCLKQFQDKVWKNANNNIIVKREYGKWQKVVCPHCGQKLKVKCYKNRSVTIELRDK